jgi:hypothetical protein
LFSVALATSMLSELSGVRVVDIDATG